MLCRRLDGSSKDSNWLQCLITYTEQHFTFSLFTSEHFSLEFLYLPQNVGLLAKFFPKDWTFLSHWLFLSSLISRIWFLSSLKGYIFVKILHIFSISNAAVLPDSKSCVQKKLCAKAETFLSMCMRCITSRDSCCTSQAPPTWDIFTPWKVAPLYEHQRCLPSEPSQRVMWPWLAHLTFSITSTEQFLVEGIQACFTDVLMEVQKS